MNNYYTVGNGIVTISSNVELNQKYLYPITSGDKLSPIDITINIVDDIKLPDDMDRVDRFYSAPDNDYIFFNDVYYRKPYNIFISGVLTKTTIKATPATLKREHQTLKGNLYSIINDLILIKLIEKGYTYIHAGCVSKNGKGILFPGFCGSGKTLKTHEMLENGYKYLSDDLALIDREGKAYLNYAPSTVSYDDYIKHVDCELKTKIRSKIVEKNLFLMKYIPLPTVDIVGDNTVPQTKVDTVQLLSESHGDLLEKIIEINEYSINLAWQNRIWWMYSYYNDTFDIDLIRTKYKNILQLFLLKVVL